VQQPWRQPEARAVIFADRDATEQLRLAGVLRQLDVERAAPAYELPDFTFTS
jgi:hypothetical protein